MKVIIELNENVDIESIDNDEEHLAIHVANNGVAKININDLKLALRKLTAK